MSEARSYRVTLQPLDRSIDVPAGTRLYEAIEQVRARTSAAALQSLRYATVCGGNGTCGKCRVRISTENPPPITDEEYQALSPREIADGIRLSCCLTVQQDLECTLLHAMDPAAPQIQTSFTRTSSAVQSGPLFRAVRLFAACPSITDQRSTLTRLQQVLAGCAPDHERAHWPAAARSALPTVERFLQKSSDRRGQEPADLTLELFDHQVVGISLGAEDEEEAHRYGAAIDIGTTTIAVYLVQLGTGRVLGAASALNPQSSRGSDVIARISYTIEHEQGTQLLQKMVIRELEQLIAELLHSHLIPDHQFRCALLVGNTTMLHLLLGMPPITLARYPYIPLFTSEQQVLSSFSLREAGQTQTLIPAADHRPLLQAYPGCSCLCGPSASAYLGADVVSGCIAADMDRAEDVVLFIDIGTNGEIVLSCRGSIFAASAAAGPAFEGAVLSCGSAGVSGAIDHVWMDGSELVFSTIDRVPAHALCGSGAVDAAAVLLDQGIIRPDGRFAARSFTGDTQEGTERPLSSRCVIRDGKKTFMISDDIWLTGKDIREIQLAKAAVAAGIDALLSEAAIGAEQIDRVLIAGGFGTSLSSDALLRIGMLPAVPAGCIEMIGNSAGSGAVDQLISIDTRDRCRRLSQKMQIIELSSRASFARELVRHVHFPDHRSAHEQRKEVYS
jgi:uncharacterized 2Fe-2S/4Fe-4S cluster protein (DUF4445 family)